MRLLFIGAIDVVRPVAVANFRIKLQTRRTFHEVDDVIDARVERSATGWTGKEAVGRGTHAPGTNCQNVMN